MDAKTKILNVLLPGLSIELGSQKYRVTWDVKAIESTLTLIPETIPEATVYVGTHVIAVKDSINIALIAVEMSHPFLLQNIVSDCLRESPEWKYRGWNI